MSSHKRSTNERVIARHRLKRSHTSNDPVPQFIDSNAADNVVPVQADVLTDSPAINPVPLLTTDGGVVPSVLPVESVPPIVESAAPPIGTARPLSTSLPPTFTTTTIFVHSTLPSTSSSASTSPTSHTLASTSPHAVPLGVSSTSSSPVATNTVVRATSNTHGLSQGALGGIMTVTVVLVVAMIAFFVRKHQQRRATLRRDTWGAGLIPALENKRNTIYADRSKSDQPLSSSHDRPANAPRVSEVFQIPAAEGVSIVAPPASFNQAGLPLPTPPYAASPVSAPSFRSVTTSSIRASRVELAIVARTFIPSLPDELHIANGEHIQILNAYDDGWALCVNMRGEQGVVPLECLEKVVGTPTGDMQLRPQNEFGDDSNRTSRRLSSLTPKAAGTY